MSQFTFLLCHLNLTLSNHFCDDFNVSISWSVPTSDDDIPIEPSAGVPAAKLVMCQGAGAGQGAGGGGADRGLGRTDGQRCIGALRI